MSFASKLPNKIFFEIRIITSIVLDVLMEEIAEKQRLEQVGIHMKRFRSTYNSADLLQDQIL